MTLTSADRLQRPVPRASDAITLTDVTVAYPIPGQEPRIVLSGARAGVRSADAEWLLLSSVLGARKHQLFSKVMLPVATPAIFAALRLGLIYSLLGVVGSELISARDGLGQLIAYDSSVFQMDGVYGILVLLAVIAVILNQLMSFLERRLLRWQPPADR